MKKLIRVIVLLIPFYSSAQNYNVLLIPDSLTKHANIVKRYEEIRIEIKDLDKIKTYKKYVYTILNEGGDDYADYVSGYDKFNDINYINGTLYDAMGKELKSVKKKDIEDLSGNNDESLMVDRRYKRHNFYYKNYPYTVEYEEEDNKNNTYELPDWMPQRSNIESIELSRFIIVTPENIPIRYKRYNFDKEPSIKKENGLITYTWEIKNQTAKIGEQFQPDWKKIFPLVRIAPTNFIYGGYKGDMTTWESFSTFGYSLLDGRDLLPDAIKQKVHELTDNLSSPKEKIQTLYAFLQQNTRYISIQLGIGGLQPFDANYVVTKRYGDCKALSNYMVALLKEAGIKGYSAWIYGSWKAPEAITDFPSDQFNHVIACVPLDKDTMWLECTSQTDPPGYNGGFTGNRYALILKEKGGQFVPTTRYSADENKQLRDIDATLDETGKLTMTVKTQYHCQQQDMIDYYINHLSKDKTQDYLKNSIDLPDYDLKDFDYKENKTEKPYVDETLNLIANNYAPVSGKRMFLVPDILNKSVTKLNTDSVRKYDLEYDRSFSDIDSINIKIPSGYNIESMPKDVTINNKFGEYKILFKVNGENVSCIRLLKRNQGCFPAADYAELAKFYESMYKADRSKIVFVKKEG